MCAFIFVCFHRLVCRLLSWFRPGTIHLECCFLFMILPPRSFIRFHLLSIHYEKYEIVYLQHTEMDLIVSFVRSFVRPFCPRTTRITSKRLFFCSKARKKNVENQKKIVSFTQVQNRAINHFSVCAAFSSTSFSLALSLSIPGLFFLICSQIDVVAVAIFAFFLCVCCSVLRLWKVREPAAHAFQ